MSGAGDASGTLGALVGALVFWLVVLALYIWTAAALAAVFRKSGTAPWKAWVPVVSLWAFFRLGGRPGWWSLVYALGWAVVAAAELAFLAAGAGGTRSGWATLLGVLVGTVGGVALAIFSIVTFILGLVGVNRGFRLGAGHIALGFFLFPVWASVTGWGGARWRGRDEEEQVSAAPSRAAEPRLPPPPAPDEPGQPEQRPAAVRASDSPTIAELQSGARVTPAAAVSPPPSSPGVPLPSLGIVSAPSASPSIVPPPVQQQAMPEATPAPLAETPTARTSGASALTGRTPAGPEAAEPAPSVPPTPAVPPPSAALASPAPSAPGPSGSLAAGEAQPTVPLNPWAPPPAAAASPSFLDDVLPPAAGLDLPAAEADELDERTAVAARRLGVWRLLMPDGVVLTLPGDTVVLGRAPVIPAAAPDARPLVVRDGTRTVSKTHALLRRGSEGWTITDLGSTNGILVVDASGGQTEAPAGVPVRLPPSGAFYLGDAKLVLRAEG